MSASIFVDKNVMPDQRMLKEMLGNTFSVWEDILNKLISVHGPISHEWKFYGKNYGWQLKTYLKKRNLFFLIPCKNYFTLIFVFGDRGVAEIEKSALNDHIKESVRNAKKYAEGRGLSIKVKKPVEIPVINKLIAIKINN